MPDRNVCRQILAAIDEEWMNGKPWCYAKNSPRWAVRNHRAALVAGPHDVVKRMLDQWTANKIIEEDNRDAKRHIKGYRKLTRYLAKVTAKVRRSRIRLLKSLCRKCH